LEARTVGGSTALHIAAKYANFKAVKLLLNAGADKMAKMPSGVTAMDIVSKLVPTIPTASVYTEDEIKKTAVLLRDRFLAEKLDFVNEE
jgi:ankyrin repeat protein